MAVNFSFIFYLFTYGSSQYVYNYTIGSEYITHNIHYVCNLDQPIIMAINVLEGCVKKLDFNGIYINNRAHYTVSLKIMHTKLYP